MTTRKAISQYQLPLFDFAQMEEAPQAASRQPVILKPRPQPKPAPSTPLQSLIGKTDQVSDEVIDVLRRASFEGKTLMLTGQLDRKIYLAVNEALSRIGGQWNKKAKGHVFPDENDPQALLDLILETRAMPPKNPTAFYPTPEGLAARMAQRIPDYAQYILEPSAGTGNIARAIRDCCVWNKISAQLDCCEVLPQFRAKLEAQGFLVVAEDFLRYDPPHPYDVILMNPPFSMENDRLAYVTHIWHAWQMLAEGGHLGAIIPSGFEARGDTRVLELRNLVEEVGGWEELPAGTFKGSGTGVNTILLEMYK